MIMKSTQKHFYFILTCFAFLIIIPNLYAQTSRITKNVISKKQQETDLKKVELHNLILTEDGLKCMVFKDCYTIEQVNQRVKELGLNNFNMQKAFYHHSEFHGPPPDYIQKNNITGKKSATINVTYNGFSTEAQTAFQYAVDIWEATITSSVTINVVANWTVLGAGVLGSAGANWFHRDFGAGQANTWYHAALANELAGTDLTTEAEYPSDSHEINASFNSDFSNWYLGTDGNPGDSEYDFVTVVLHELCHGLQFSGSMEEISGNRARWGLGTGYPFIYDRYTEDLAGNALINTGVYSNPSTALMTQVTTDLENFVDAPLNFLTNNDTRSILYTPATWSGGSSYSHWRDGTYDETDNSLMTHAITDGESQHDPGPLTLAFFIDMGWPMDQTNVVPDIDFSAATYQVIENAGPGQLTVSRISGDLDIGSIVQVDITGGTATGGAASPADYDNTSFPLTVSFGPSETSINVNVPLFDDTSIEGDETVTFSVTSVTNADITGQTTTTLNITDHETLSMNVFNSTAFVDENSVTLQNDDVIQLLWTGADGQIDDPVKNIGEADNGQPTDDDQILTISAIGVGTSNPGQFSFTIDTYPDRSSGTPIDGDYVYIRAFNNSSLINATHYDDAQLYTVTHVNGENYTAALDNNDTDQSLPVELSSFIAQSGNGQITLKWITQSELNNLGFIIERGTQSEGPFEEIASYNNMTNLMGQGNTTRQTNYNYTDTDVLNCFTYFYRLIDVNYSGQRTLHGPISASLETIDPNIQKSELVASKLHLHQNFPNPFNPETTIKFDVPSNTNEMVKVELTIYNNLGQLVRTIYKGEITSGGYQAKWDGTNEQNIRQPSGIYLLRFTAGKTTQIRKMLMVN